MLREVVAQDPVRCSGVDVVRTDQHPALLLAPFLAHQVVDRGDRLADSARRPGKTRSSTTPDLRTEPDRTTDRSAPRTRE